MTERLTLNNTNITALPLGLQAVLLRQQVGKNLSSENGGFAL